MNLFIQDPSFANGYSMHEALLAGCADIQYGAGVFAFVTSGGVNLFLCDKVFEDFVKSKKGKFQLIVGIDEITNTRTLLKLEEIQSMYGNSIEVFVLVHNHTNTTFHPKFSWFKKDDGGVLIVGSNNLTEKGLRKNIEAFTYIEVDEVQIKSIEDYYDSWILCNKENLYSIKDEIVIAKAKENERITNYRKKVTVEVEPDEEPDEELDEELDERESEEDLETTNNDDENYNPIDEEDFGAWGFSGSNSVLVAQIPKSGNRWNQANFDKDTFQTFFGAQAGQNGFHRILLRSVDSSGKIGSIETRPSVSVVSQNYRFELEAAAGISYPKIDRPIAVFIKIAIRMYLYILVMPDDPYYSELDSFIHTFKGPKMVRYRTDVNDLKSHCPNLPLWRISR